jgi:hypothetical protein
MALHVARQDAVPADGVSRKDRGQLREPDVEMRRGGWQSERAGLRRRKRPGSCAFRVEPRFASRPWRAAIPDAGLGGDGLDSRRATDSFEKAVVRKSWGRSQSLR